MSDAFRMILSEDDMRRIERIAREFAERFPGYEPDMPVAALSALRKGLDVLERALGLPSLDAAEKRDLGPAPDPGAG